MKFNPKSFVLFVAPYVAASVEAFTEYLVNAGGHLDKATIVHALAAAVLVDVALAKAAAQPAPVSK